MANNQKGGLIRVEAIEMMNVIEISMLIDWLREHDHSEAEINDCIQFIAGRPAMDRTTKTETR